jgi:hypothetical protein
MTEERTAGERNKTCRHGGVQGTAHSPPREEEVTCRQCGWSLPPESQSPGLAKLPSASVFHEGRCPVQAWLHSRCLINSKDRQDQVAQEARTQGTGDAISSKVYGIRT